MPKPFTGVSANGHHHHFTLVDDDGNNVFHDPDGPAQLSEMGRHFLGGMLDHFGALMCVGNSTVNSYCRMWDTGFWAPIYKNWGWQNRTCTVRVASGGRFEYRGVDSSCNPYLTVAALLRAGLDGLKRKSDPGPPQAGNTYDLLTEGVELERVPDSLGAALDALAADEVVKGAMPGPAVQGVRALQARRVGALPGRGHRLGARGVPGGAALEAIKMCGIAGIIYRNGGDEHQVGRDMTRMLQAMKHRGPDSTGYALYRGDADTYVMHVKLSEGGESPELEARVKRQRAEVEARMRALGAEIEEIKGTMRTMTVIFGFDGDLKLLADAVERVRHTEVLSLGRSLEIVKDLGDAETVAEEYGLPDYIGTHAIGHARMATESDVDIANAHPYWAYPFPDVAVVHNGQLTNFHDWRRRLQRSGHRFQSECDSEIIAVYLAQRMSEGLSLEEAMRRSLTELDGVFTYICVTEDALGVAKDELGAKPLVLYEDDELVALASEEIAIRQVLDREITTHDPYEGTVRVWTR